MAIFNNKIAFLKKSDAISKILLLEETFVKQNLEMQQFHFIY